MDVNLTDFRLLLNVVHGGSLTAGAELSHVSIAAASILAKTDGDAYMEGLHLEHPGYNWAVNKGYPTPDHRAALEQQGPCVHHRRSFRLLKDQLDLF